MSILWGVHMVKGHMGRKVKAQFLHLQYKILVESES